MVAGDEYVAAITARESDRRTRRAFQELALRSASPGRDVFDFGAGPGIDAKQYAAHGLRVLAYDIDPRMCASFIRHCGAEIAAGRVHLYEGNYRAFLERVPHLRSSFDIGLVTANFAPLNLVDDLRELFAGLHALTGRRAKLVASVLNPNYVGDLCYRWWWANRLRYWRKGSFSVAGTDMSIHRHSIRRVTDLAAPHFTLEAVQRDSSPLARRYLFLIFARR